MSRSKPEITKRQKQLLDELQNCVDEMSSQALHRRLLEKKLSMVLTTVYSNLQSLINMGLVRSRHLPTGEFLYKWGAEGLNKGELASPSGIAIDGSDNVYVADQYSNRITIYDFHF